MYTLGMDKTTPKRQTDVNLTGKGVTSFFCAQRSYHKIYCNTDGLTDGVISAFSRRTSTANRYGEQSSIVRFFVALLSQIFCRSNGALT